MPHQRSFGAFYNSYFTAPRGYQHTSATALPLAHLPQPGHAEAYLATRLVNGPERRSRPAQQLGGLVEDGVQPRPAVRLLKQPAAVRYPYLWNAPNV